MYVRIPKFKRRLTITSKIQSLPECHIMYIGLKKKMNRIGFHAYRGIASSLFLATISCILYNRYKCISSHYFENIRTICLRYKKKAYNGR